MKDNTAIACIKNGKLEGEINKGLYIFRGIPYAVPPMGELRWMPPQPVKPWDGIRPAKMYGAIAPQPTMPNMGSVGAPSFEGQAQSEDCLFLNVWTPGIDDNKRPVYFWIHGGAFYIGAGNESYLDEGILARRGDIVIVSINYRLGAFGFLNLNEITGGKIPSSGNEGILDQIAALEWVQENIAAFGGDPQNVTISGFSAGGMSTGTLLGMPAARGKFHKALNRSGAANINSPLANGIAAAKGFLKAVNFEAKDIDALRGLSTQQVLEGQMRHIALMQQMENRATPFQPVVDGKYLPEFPMEAIKKDSAKNIPVMAGTSLDEMKFMYAMGPDAGNLSEEVVVRRLNGMLPADFVPGLMSVYREVLKNRGGSATYSDVLGSINTDLMFRIPTIRLLELQRDNGTPAYNYLFTHRSPAMNGAFGAMHGLDNPFLFGALNKDFTGDDEELRNLAKKIQDSAIAFIRTGNPTCESAGEWPVYGSNRATMIFDRNTRVENAPYETERAAWDSYYYIANPPL